MLRATPLKPKQEENQSKPLIIPIDQAAIQQNDQADLKPDLDQKDRPQSAPIERTVQKSVPSKSVPSNRAYAPIEQTDYEIMTTQELDKIGYTKVANYIIDSLPSLLDPYEILVYLKLYRLAYGFHNHTCMVGYTGISKATNISVAQVRRAVAKLTSIGLVRVIEVIKTKDIQGSKYEVRVPKVCSNRAYHLIDRTVQESNNKEIDDHDSLNKDHHQNEVMMIYKNLTGNDSWTKSDVAAYEKLKHLSLQEISQLIKSTLEKAHQKPASLAYFVKAYLTPTQANPANKSAVKAKLAAIVERKREAHVGTRYTIADLTFDVKSECIREGISFDNELFNDIILKKF